MRAAGSADLARRNLKFSLRYSGCGPSPPETPGPLLLSRHTSRPSRLLTRGAQRTQCRESGPVSVHKNMLGEQDRTDLLLVAGVGIDLQLSLQHYISRTARSGPNKRRASIP